MPCCEISNRAQMSKTIIAVRHFGLGGRESLKTVVNLQFQHIFELERIGVSWNKGCYDLPFHII